MKKFTKKQKTFIGVFPLVYIVFIIFFAVINEKAYSVSVLQALASILWKINFFLSAPPALITNSLNEIFHINNKYFLIPAALFYYIFIGFIFVSLYKKIFNR